MLRPRNASVLTPPSASPLMLIRGLGSPRQGEPGHPVAGEIKNLQSLASLRRVGDCERAVAPDVEGRRFQHAAPLAADLDHLANPLGVGVDAVDRMPTPIEDVIDAGGCLLDRQRLAEYVADLGRKAANGVQGFDLAGAGAPG